MLGDLGTITETLGRGGPVMFAIAGLSLITLALILWKLWRYLWGGVWGGSDMGPAMAAWSAGDLDGAEALIRNARGIRARMARAAMAVRRDRTLTDQQAREEVTRLAQAELRDVRRGLRALELIATIAPLLGLLGTVLGMIEAFQALQESGARADPGILAGGIWEALLTTAAGMAVAIPAALAGAWYEAVADRAQGEMEDVATRVFTRGPSQGNV